MTVSKVFKLFLFIFFTLNFLFVSCSKDDDTNSTDFGIFSVVDDTTVQMNGEINSATLNDFNRLIEKYPNLKTINMKEVPGSLDDETNLQVALKVHQRNMTTHLLDNGLIASGGVDFFLAGTTRSKGENTMIGVHSWSDGSNEATTFPVGHANHLPYINFYKNVGFSQSDAEAFYYFTINAASANDIHYMTADEIEQYKILKQ